MPTDSNFDALRFDPEFDFSEDELEKKLMDPNIHLDSKDHIILMSFELPVKIVKQNDGTFTMKSSNSMLYPLIFKLKDKGIKNFTWIGWP